MLFFTLLRTLFGQRYECAIATPFTTIFFLLSINAFFCHFTTKSLLHHNYKTSPAVYTVYIKETHFTSATTPTSTMQHGKLSCALYRVVKWNWCIAVPRLSALKMAKHLWMHKMVKSVYGKKYKKYLTYYS